MTWAVLLVFFSCKKESSTVPSTLELLQVKIGSQVLTVAGPNSGMPVDSLIYLAFNAPVDTASARNNIILKTQTNLTVTCTLTFSQGFTVVSLKPVQALGYMTSYKILANSGLKSSEGGSFIAKEFSFTTRNGTLQIKSITINQVNFQSASHPRNIDWKNVAIEVQFSTAVDSSNFKTYFTLSNIPVTCALSDSNRKVTVTNNENLLDYSQYYFNISSFLKARNGFTFDGFSNYFYTALDSTPKFPILTDEQLLDLVQHQTFRYFYDFAHPACGMSRERNTSGDVVTTGGSGFGVMGLVVGMNRGFITRDDGLTRLNQILTFLETCDRFHGVWPHWLNGNTGHVVPFGPKDDGGDIVETSYMVMGLLTMRQYLDSTITSENSLRGRITALVDSVDWQWYTQGQNVLYWNWSPTYGFAINVKVQGYNETLITYVTAASSPTHAISPAAYHQGYAQNGGIVNGNNFYGYVLPLGEPFGGPLFFTQYTYLGLDPRNLSDQYANYWEQNVNQSLINYSYCVANPKGWVGYSSHSWGLTASDNPWGYSAHSPTNDLGVISPTAAVSALPYTPVQSMNAIKHFYYILGNKLWGNYGYYDAFDVTAGWWASSYIAIDEGPIIGMIENYRTQLLWNLFMSNAEIRQGLTRLGFSYK